MASRLRSWFLPPFWHSIPADARRREIFAVNLRTVAGWSKSDFLALPGATEQEWQTFPNIIAPFGSNLCTLLPERIKLTEEGLLFWDSIASELL